YTIKSIKMKKLIPLLFVLASVLFLSNIVKSQETKTLTFEEYKEQQNAQYNQYVESVTLELEKYMLEEQKGIEKLRQEIEDYWGANGFKVSSKKDWIEYSKDKKTRTDVDFENGSAKVEILLDPEEADNPAKVKAKLKTAIEGLIVSKGKTKDYETEREKPKELLDTPVLDGQLQTHSGNKVNNENASEYANEILNADNIKAEKLQGSDGKTRIKVYISLPLAPDHIKTRSTRFQNSINKYSNQFSLPPELIYAVIHTESYFNPKARSHVPAFGLMQIVPKYAGRDAYQYLYDQDKMLSSNYLYEPTQNIELGTAYLRLLMTREFKKVKDEQCKILCCIAAYNTGAGNVSKAFTGNTNIYKAIKIINKLNYRKLFDILHKDLPYQETRDYIVRVTDRMKKYKNWEGE
ncbi:MAG: murein transglycosylase domain-containing protein, partial [Bacteroidales bacterium]|nr:murein transglycosylase domain-containing protein [Bacteroidales bacterium]